MLEHSAPFFASKTLNRPQEVDPRVTTLGPSQERHEILQALIV
jgi:hypothetical protein